MIKMWHPSSLLHLLMIFGNFYLFHLLSEKSNLSQTVVLYYYLLLSNFPICLLFSLMIKGASILLFAYYFVVMIKETSI